MKLPLQIDDGIAVEDADGEPICLAISCDIAAELVALANSHATLPGPPTEDGLLQFVKDFIAEYDSPWCTCIDAYKDRQLTDPDCHGCGMRDMFYDLREKAGELIAKHQPLEVPNG